MRQVPVYSERWKSGCQRVAKVLTDRGLNPEVERSGKSKDWLVYVPTRDYGEACQIVWGTTMDAIRDLVHENVSDAEEGA